MENTKKVAIIMGSDSDWPTVKAAAAQLKSWDIREHRAARRRHPR